MASRKWVGCHSESLCHHHLALLRDAGLFFYIRIYQLVDAPSFISILSLDGNLTQKAMGIKTNSISAPAFLFTTLTLCNHRSMISQFEHAQNLVFVLIWGGLLF